MPFIGSTTNREYHRIRQNTRSRRSRLGRYLFCRRRSLKGRQNRCRPDLLGFMRVCGLFESEFSSTLHRRCPNPELDIFPFAGPFIRFSGRAHRSDLFEGLCVGYAPRKRPICGRWFLIIDARHIRCIKPVLTSQIEILEYCFFTTKHRISQ